MPKPTHLRAVALGTTSALMLGLVTTAAAAPAAAADKPTLPVLETVKRKDKVGDVTGVDATENENLFNACDIGKYTLDVTEPGVVVATVKLRDVPEGDNRVEVMFAFMAGRKTKENTSVTVRAWDGGEDPKIKVFSRAKSIREGLADNVDFTADIAEDGPATLTVTMPKKAFPKGFWIWSYLPSTTPLKVDEDGKVVSAGEYHYADDADSGWHHTPVR